MQWDFQADPLGNDTNFGDEFNTGNHAYIMLGQPAGYSGAHETGA